MQNLKTLKVKITILFIGFLILITFQSSLAAIVLGNPKGDVRLSFIYDYECVYCKNTYFAIKEIIDSYKNDKNNSDKGICLKLYPVAILNQHSIVKASASVVATKYQNQFQKLNDYLFSSYPVRLDELINELKKQGLSSEEFLKSMHDPSVKEQLDQGLELLKEYNLSSAPLIIIESAKLNHSGIVLPGEQTVDTLRGAIANVRSSN